MPHPFLADTPNSRCEVRLFCLPYAGAGASRYFCWTGEFPEEIDVCPILLPGREGRIGEPAFTEMDALVSTLARALVPELDHPFALFGHSMGALIAFELARFLRQHFGITPLHLFASGYRAPHLPHREPRLHDIATGDFFLRIRNLQDAPDEATGNEEFMALMLPTLRADLKLCETYRYRSDRPLSCPISAFGGTHDWRVTEADLAAWAEHSTADFCLRMLQGGHLFLHERKSNIIRFILGDLSSRIERP